MLREIKAICASQLQLLTQHEYWDVSDCYVKWYLSCRISRRATCPLPSWLWIWWRLRLQGLVGLLSTGRCCRSPYISSHQLRLHEVKGMVHWKFTFYTSPQCPRELCWQYTLLESVRWWHVIQLEILMEALEHGFYISKLAAILCKNMVTLPFWDNLRSYLLNKKQFVKMVLFFSFKSSVVRVLGITSFTID